MVCFTAGMLFFSSQRAALIGMTTQGTQELSDIHSSMQLTDRTRTATSLTAGQGVHTHLHPQVCTLYWSKVKYWPHSTKQTSEKLLWWLTHSAAAACSSSLQRDGTLCLQLSARREASFPFEQVEFQSHYSHLFGLPGSTQSIVNVHQLW